jgi:hypothetical protein
MATGPEQVRIRSYNVGFGDGFLLTFTYADGDERNVLIDFGSSEKSDFTPDRGMLAIAEQIKADCGGKLEMVVATHRHSDHVSGFARRPGSVIRSLAPEVVLQPWTEEPGLDPNAQAPAAAGGLGLQSRRLVARLSDMQRFAAAVLGELPRLEAAPEVPRAVTDQLRFLGETNLRNAAAVRSLATMGTRQVYASFGTRLAVAGILPGVKVSVIGPPTLEQSPEISDQVATHPTEFWHLAAGRARKAARAADGRLFPAAAVASRRPQEARSVIPKIDAMRAEEMLALVRSLDDALNNTSLILIFEFGRQRLVFPGDAQIENWSYALFQARNREAIRARLRNATFYKVGHHGSLNATPKTLWNSFSKRDEAESPARLTTMVSTLADKHGESSRGTEVPREKLITALKHLSDFHTTQDLPSRSPFWVDVVLQR